jgi:phosphoglycerol transferase
MADGVNKLLVRVSPSKWATWVSTTVVYLWTFLLAIGGALWVHKIRFVDLNHPWRVIDSDLSSVYSLAQATGQSWVGLTNQSLGAPHRADLSLAFIPDDLHLEIIRLITHISGSPFIGVNLFYLLTFGFSAVTFLALLGIMGTRKWISFPLALAYSWLPYHFLRMDVGHVFLAAYYMIPIGIMYLLRLFKYLDEPQVNFLPSKKWSRLAFICGIALVGSSGAYYAFFFALLTGSLLLLVPRRGITRIAFLKRLGTVSLVGFAFIIAPVLRVLSSQLRGLETVLTRDPLESVQFGGSITRLLIPWGVWLPENLRPAVAAMEFEWNATPLVGSIGVIVLILTIVLRIARQDNFKQLDAVSYLFFWSTALYTTSGLGLLFAYAVDPSFRCWNRFSILIMTLSLTAVAVVLNRFKFRNSMVSPLLLLLIVMTQLLPLNDSGISKEPDATSRKAYQTLKKTALLIEERTNPGCQILQLPLMVFPEGGQVGAVGNGFHLWLPLLTKGYRWSYGAPKGSEAGDFWTGMSTETAITKAKNLDFCAVILDKRSGTSLTNNDVGNFSRYLTTELYDLYWFK